MGKKMRLSPALQEVKRATQLFSIGKRGFKPVVWREKLWRGDLSKFHGDLSKFHGDLSKFHGDLSKFQRST
jgi:hypothetical protein